VRHPSGAGTACRRCAAFSGSDHQEAANPASGQSDAAGGDSAADAKQKAADSTAQLELASIRLKRAQMDLDQHKIESAAAGDKARTDVADAQKELDHFVNVEMPQKKARAQLDLQQATDFTTDQEEEMQQLELMYQKDDLADKTKEIVLARGKRRLERARQSLALQQKDLDDLVNVQQPQQRQKLELALKESQAALQRAEFAAQSGEIDKQMAVRSQQIEVEKQQRELDKAKKDAGLARADDARRGTPPSDAPVASAASFLYGQL